MGMSGGHRGAQGGFLDAMFPTASDDVSSLEEIDARIAETRARGREPHPDMLRRRAELAAQREPLDASQADAARGVGLADERLQRVALAARRRTGQGLSSTFVTGQGVGGQRPPSLLGG